MDALFPPAVDGFVGAHHHGRGLVTAHHDGHAEQLLPGEGCPAEGVPTRRDRRLPDPRRGRRELAGEGARQLFVEGRGHEDAVGSPHVRHHLGQALDGPPELAQDGVEPHGGTRFQAALCETGAV
ncbi:hypothetical protein [Streptomyces akebiae]|uniref:Uncharacterized protein n=1 Tax=Streptomyces akebiae TaxID=2865673 RepID=A0ABX8Y2D0_9ACTN|nr:hypothetical protein [Streptomyces akebiae]QYX81919.1 hypothetical protein K1J60_39985 [Streptomyces akebiae]